MMLITAKCFAALALLTQLASCNSTLEGTYRGGVLAQPGALAIQDHYAFRLMDKWRISHAWLSGPVDIDYCRYSRRGNSRGEDRFFEVDGVLKMESVSGDPRDKGAKKIWNQDEKIYGTRPSTGKFKGYSAFCSHGFEDIWTGISVHVVRPDSTKGTDEWVEGAMPVAINGLNWLRKNIAIKNYSQDKKGSAPIEI